MTQSFPRRTAIATLLMAAIAPAPLLAHDHDDDKHRHLREAVRSGKLLPLNRIIALAQARAPGEIIKIELDDEDGRVIYEVKTLSKAGRVMKVELDAATGRLVKIEED
jgi:uncharacterized membrane protein YkoI